MENTELVLWIGLAIGTLFGACAQATGFCLHRGLKEIWTGRSGYKLHAFAAALAVALAGTQMVAAQELVNIKQSLYLNPTFSWLLVPLGGLMFGLGMSLANGCGARALVLLGQGNLRSFVVLLCLGIAAYMTLTGLLAPLRIYLAQHSSLTLASPTLAPGLMKTLATGALILGLGIFALTRRHDGRRWQDLAGGVFIGLLIIAGWVTTGWLGDDPFEPMPVTSLSFVAPVGETIQYAMISTGMSPRIGLMIVLGVLGGSFLTAVLRRRYRLEGFESPGQMARYMLGGALMGIGGVLALGCTVGQGLTGLSTLAYSSFVAVAGIVAGARLGLRLNAAQ